MGEIGQGAFMDLFTLTAAFAQEDGGGKLRLGPVSTYMGNDITYG